MTAAVLRRTPEWSEAREKLARGLVRARGDVAFVSVAAPPASVAQVWAAWPGGGTAAHHAPEGPAIVGLGVAAEYRSAILAAAGPLRWARQVLAGEGAGNAGIFAGCGFSPSSVGTGPWADFPAMRLVLPRWRYRLEGGRATLTLAIEGTDLAGSGRSRAVEELGEIWARLSRPLRGAPPRAALRQLSPRRWHTLADGARRAIAARRFDKLVPARSAQARAPEAWDAALVIQALSGSPGCTVFACRQGSATFLGATPERLVARRGRRLFTEALAGTLRQGIPETELSGSRIAREHELVIGDIIRKLRPVCTALVPGPRPALRALADMVHLRTPIEGRLRRDVHVLELALRLHPTPAVAGLPAAKAVRWLEAHEPAPRGWYAGFVGWFDARGDGELSVAIRSGLLRGRVARLYAGSGMVAGSTAPAEHAETALKQRPFLRALGFVA
ncbi:MAG: isochorismate synthase [Myxococcales bacterium]